MVYDCFLFFFLRWQLSNTHTVFHLAPHALLTLAGPAPVPLQVGHADKGVAQQCLGVRAGGEGGVHVHGHVRVHVLNTNPASFCTPPPQSCIDSLSLPPKQPKNPTRTSSPRTKAYVHAVLPELHQHLSCVVCPGSFVHVAFGLGLFARVAFDRADSAESQVRPFVGPVVCLRGNGPAKFSSARALTHHPRRWRLGMRGGLFFSACHCHDTQKWICVWWAYQTGVPRWSRKLLQYSLHDGPCHNQSQQHLSVKKGVVEQGGVSKCRLHRVAGATSTCYCAFFLG